MSAKGIHDPAVRAFLEKARFATIATIDADGAPFSAVVWYAVEADHLVVNSAEGRRWPSNLRRDPRASLMVEDGYNYVQILGRVRIDDDQERAQTQMAAMAARYLSNAAVLEKSLAEFRTQHRVLIELHPHAIFSGGSAAIKRASAES